MKADRSKVEDRSRSKSEVKKAGRSDFRTPVETIGLPKPEMPRYERRKTRRGKPRRRESGGKPPHSKYGVCCHLRCGFYGAGGGARGTGVAQLRDCASRR